MSTTSGKIGWFRPDKDFILIINKDQCKGCGLCVTLCPKSVLALTKEVNRTGYQTSHAVKPEECSKCRKCELTCPDFAIYVLTDVANEPWLTKPKLTVEVADD